MADARRRRFLAGDTIQWRGATLEALWPASFSDTNLNRHSLVLMIQYRGVRLLLMGDADVMVERALLERGRFSGPVDLLVAGHHGAGDATSEGFLAAARPGYAVISVNSNNMSHRTVESRRKSGNDAVLWRTTGPRVTIVNIS